MINTKKALMWLWVTLALIILFTLILFNQSYAGDSDYFDDLSYREKTIAKKMERKYLGRSESVLRFKGDARIDQDELVDGDIITLKGTLNIEGEVEGDALSVFGDVDLGSDAYVHGDVISVNGKVWTHDDARVGGDIVVTNVPLDDDDDDEHVTIQQRPRTPRKKEKWSDDSDEVVYADYTRVDGLTLGLQFPQPGWWANRNHSFALLGKGGYSFASKRWQYKVGLERWTHSDFRFTLGAEIHDMSDTEDRWIICDHENALAAFFIKEDFRDYYNRKGYSVYASQHLGRNVKLQASYHNDDFHNLKKRTNWSLFGKGKDFRDNPLALPYEYSAINGFDAPLNIKSVSATFTIDTRNHPKHPNKGWFINAFAEHAGDQMDNSIQFERYILDIAHYFPLSWDEHISMRLRGRSEEHTSELQPPCAVLNLKSSRAIVWCWATWNIICAQAMATFSDWILSCSSIPVSPGLRMKRWRTLPTAGLLILRYKRPPIKCDRKIRLKT